MATITEDVTTITPTEYETPVFRQYGNLYLKIHAANKMLVVDSTLGKESISIKPYPSLGITKISDTDEILEAAFTAAYDAAVTIFDGV